MDEKTCDKVLVMGWNTELSVAVASGLLDAQMDLAMVGSTDNARRWIEREKDRFAALIIAIGDRGEGLAFIRELRDEEALHERPRRPMVAISDVALPEADKLCASTGADAILPRNDVPKIIETIRALLAER